MPMEHSQPFRNRCHRRSPLAAAARRSPLAAAAVQARPRNAARTAGAPNSVQSPAARRAAHRQFRRGHLPAANASCTPTAIMPAARPPFNLFTALASGLAHANARRTAAPPPACARARPSRRRRRRPSALGSRGRAARRRARGGAGRRAGRGGATADGEPGFEDIYITKDYLVTEQLLLSQHSSCSQWTA
jgi:hypothetical protein